MITKKLSTALWGSLTKILLLILSSFIINQGTDAYGQLTGASMEGSSTMGRNCFQLAGSYSTILPSDVLWTDGPINQVGVKAGMGILDHVDLKFSYSRWIVKGSDYHQNVFQIITKVTGDNQIVAFYLPFGLIFSRYDNAYGEDDIGKLWILTPRVIGSLYRGDYFDFCIIPYMEILKEKGYKPIITGGLNLGLGFFPDPEKLSIRFEGGVDIRSLIEGYPFGTIGIALNYFIGKKL